MRTNNNNVTCSKCETDFICDISLGKDTCWCFDYPNKLTIESKNCLCKKCLKERIQNMNKVKISDKTLLMYDGDGRYTFLNATIWECIKYWIITKLSGSDKG